LAAELTSRSGRPLTSPFASSATNGTVKRACRRASPISSEPRRPTVSGAMRIVAGRWRGRRIKAPAGDRVRPTADRVREAWMSIVGPWIPGARVLDLFAGSGALGLEALSRGAAIAEFVEIAAASLAVLRANVDALDAAEGAVIHRADAMRFVHALEPHAFDIAFADPPYDHGVASQLAE